MKVGMALQKAGEVGGDEPAYAGVGPFSADQAEDGERVDDISDGAGLDEEDILGRG